MCLYGQANNSYNTWNCGYSCARVCVDKRLSCSRKIKYIGIFANTLYKVFVWTRDHGVLFSYKRLRWKLSFLKLLLKQTITLFTFFCKCKDCCCWTSDYVVLFIYYNRLRLEYRLGPLLKHDYAVPPFLLTIPLFLNTCDIVVVVIY